MEEGATSQKLFTDAEHWKRQGNGLSSQSFWKESDLTTPSLYSSENNFKILISRIVREEICVPTVLSKGIYRKKKICVFCFTCPRWRGVCLCVLSLLLSCRVLCHYGILEAAVPVIIVIVGFCSSSSSTRLCRDDPQELKPWYFSQHPAAALPSPTKTPLK